MSVRPRPVTASLKYGLPPPPTLPPRARLDDTGDSTLSLLSINEHSSVEDEPSPEPRPAPKPAPNNKKMERKTRRLSSEPNAASGELSPWEKWLVQKEALLRRQLEEDVERQRNKRLEEEQLRTERAEKERAAEQNRKRWTQQKLQHAKLSEATQSREDALQRQLAQDKQEKIALQAQENYRKWRVSKKQQQQAQKQKELDEQQQREKELEEKRQKAEQAYQSWLQKNKTRPASAPPAVSYGYTDGGKLKKYHDRGAYPIPQYVNPTPWKHPDIPHYQTDRLNAKAKAKKLARQSRPKSQQKKLYVVTVKKCY